MFLKEWTLQRDAYLEEMLRLDGLRGLKAECSSCASNSDVFRCRDCSGDVLWCKDCCVGAHATLPFHAIEVRPHLRVLELCLTP